MIVIILCKMIYNWCYITLNESTLLINVSINRTMMKTNVFLIKNVPFALQERTILIY
nr:MAG TPA: hypothetical protein [Herelleviridae sp.]